MSPIAHNLFLLFDGAMLWLLGQSCWNLRRLLAAQKRREQSFKALNEGWINRPRARIVKVGRLVIHPNGREYPTDFLLDGHPNVPEWAIGPNGETAWGGYTQAELREIVLRRKEFE